MTTKKYCLNIKDKFTSYDLVGLKALNLNELQQNNINLSPAFIISGYAFDDFLVAGNIVGPVVDSLNEIAAHPDKISEHSKKIQGLIEKTPFPEDLKKELIEYYHSLSHGSEPFITLIQSAITPELDQTKFRDKELRFNNIKGYENLERSIKALWADLFNEDAVNYRLKLGYEGNLSQAILVTKMQNAELSGLLFNFDVNTATENQLTITANLGILQEPEFTNESDFYLLNKITGKILQTQDNNQKFMFVRAQNTAESELTQVKVSKAWSEKIKLEDGHLNKMHTLVQLIEKTFTKKFEAYWVMSGGELFITDVKQLDEPQATNLKKIPWGQSAPSNFTVEPVEQSDQLDKTPQISQQENLTEPVQEIKTEIKDKVKPIEIQAEKIILSEEERETKAEATKEMIAEVKTVTEVWWNVRRSASEIKIFKNNIDGFGIFSFQEIAGALAMKDDLEKIANSQSLQKKLAEYLSIYLVAVSPKPIFIQLQKDLDFNAQINVLSQIRNLYGHKNFWCILPEIDAPEEIAKYKKALGTEGLRRTNQFKIFQLINQPLFLANIDAIIEQAVDGILLDVDALYSKSLGLSKNNKKPAALKPDSTNFELFLNLLIDNITGKTQPKIFTYLKTESKEIMESMLEEMLENGINGVVYNENDLLDFKEMLTKYESQVLTKSLKRMKGNSAAFSTKASAERQVKLRIKKHLSRR